MKNYIPQKVHDYLSTNPDTPGSVMARELGIPERTGRRYKERFTKKYFQIVPSTQPVQSEQMELLEEEYEEVDLDKIFEEAPQLVRQAQQHDPVFTHDVYTMGEEPCAIIFVSCMHLGSRYTAYTEFRKIFEKVLSIPNLYVGMIGDEIEGFLPSFNDADAVLGQIYDLKVQYQIIDRVLGILNENNKLLFGTSSQHGSDWVQKRSGKNPIKEMYLKRGRAFYDGKVYLKFRVGSQVYNCALAHELPGNSMMNMTHAQSRALHMEFPMADIIVQGDKHKAGASEIFTFTWEVDAGNRPSNKVLLLQSGTSKVGPDKYSIRGWSRGTLEWPCAVMYPNEHKVKYSFDLEDVQHWLQNK